MKHRELIFKVHSCCNVLACLCAPISQLWILFSLFVAMAYSPSSRCSPMTTNVSAPLPSASATFWRVMVRGFSLLLPSFHPPRSPLLSPSASSPPSSPPDATRHDLLAAGVVPFLVYHAVHHHESGEVWYCPMCHHFETFCSS